MRGLNRRSLSTFIYDVVLNYVLGQTEQNYILTLWHMNISCNSYNKTNQMH